MAISHSQRQQLIAKQHFKQRMDTIQTLIGIFERFPGIGPRQAERFVQFLLRTSPSARRELADTILALGNAVRQCSSCKRYFGGATPACGLCTDQKRDDSILAIVASDADLMALEKSGTFRGRYFALGGMISLASEQTNGLRLKELLARIKGSPLTEVILAFPANPEGDATAARVRDELSEKMHVKITTLGRGLSTGSELEYADPETIRSALDNRR